MAPWKKRCASASLNLAPSILETDLLITEVLGMLAAFDWGEIQAVFCGGTSLSKGPV